MEEHKLKVSRSWNLEYKWAWYEEILKSYLKVLKQEKKVQKYPDKLGKWSGEAYYD